MRKIKLSSQLLLLYTTVTVLSAVVFGLVTFRNYDAVYKGISKSELDTYMELVYQDPRELDGKDLLGYVIAYIQEVNFTPETTSAFEVSPNVEAIVPQTGIQHELALAAYQGYFEYKASNQKIYYLGIKEIRRVDANTTQNFISILDSQYIVDLKKSSAQTDVLLSFIGTFVAFAVIMVVGNVILALWSREMTKRIKKLSDDVSLLGAQGYEKEIQITGADEISDLAFNVEEMRKEIMYNEATKQEMFQNLSHDFKTPISVIKSYAEGIEDGIIDLEGAKTIALQAEKLEQKVLRLLEYNKLEYIASDIQLEDVKMKDVVRRVLDDYKILLQGLSVSVKLDDSIFKGLKDNYITVVSNILDNATRYAKSKIIIVLKNGSLSFYNDGDPIDEKYINNPFKPYEKGTKGQFGLG
ncbi:MAG: HAMP domain-containing sensor histidine kinase, partial [Acholeplasmataceae bacterium]